VASCITGANYVVGGGMARKMIYRWVKGHSNQCLFGLSRVNLGEFFNSWRVEGSFLKV